MKTIYRLPILVLACWLCLSTAVWGSNPPPPPVTGLVAVHNGSTVPVTWDAVDNIDGYHFQARIHGGSWWAIVPVPTMSQPTVTILAAEAGRVYDVRVRTHKDGATSAWTAASTLTLLPVTGLAAVYNGTTVTVTWNAAGGVDGYHFQSRADGGNWSSTSSVPASTTTASIQSAEVGREYDVRVRTHKDGVTSAWTTVSILTLLPVTGLAAVHNGTTVTVTWNAAGGVDGYHFQSRADGGNWSSTSSVPASTTTASIQSAEAAKDYDVRVRTYKDGVGTSAWRSASARPPAVTGLAAVHRGGYVTATWTAPAVADGVHATWRYANSNHWYRVSNPQAASLRIDGLSPALTYIVAVRVRTSGGHWGPWTNSAPAACSGACTPPGPVGSLTAVHNGTTVTVTWDAPAGAVNYHVTYSTDGGGSWSLAAAVATGTTLDITGTDAAKTYIVGVRAHNVNGYGPWTNSNQAVHE